MQFGRTRQRRDHLVGERLAQHFVACLAALCGEGDDGDGRPQILRRGITLLNHGRGPDGPNPPHAHWLGDVLEVALTQVFQIGVQPSGQQIVHFGRHGGLARPGQAGDAGRQVDARAVDVDGVDVDLRRVQAGAQVELLIGRQAAVTVVEVMVQLVRGLHRLGRRIELGQQAVAQALDVAAMARGQHLGTRMLHEGVPALHDGGLVGRHQAHGFHQVHHQHHLLPTGQAPCQRLVGQSVEMDSVGGRGRRRHTL